ncbi:hypothetical protein WJX84_008355 [Apatococcus fuscideae]|uniref:Uncharacterized protein n=1 Tax=Apatococcus fuscideae TaxID=2026836 RepID=A0AAW1T6A9_9CHLO
MTRQQLKSKRLCDNFNLRSAIESWQHDQAKAMSTHKSQPVRACRGDDTQADNGSHSHEPNSEPVDVPNTMQDPSREPYCSQENEEFLTGLQQAFALPSVPASSGHTRPLQEIQRRLLADRILETLLAALLSFLHSYPGDGTACLVVNTISLLLLAGPESAVGCDTRRRLADTEMHTRAFSLLTSSHRVLRTAGLMLARPAIDDCPAGQVQAARASRGPVSPAALVDESKATSMASGIVRPGAQLRLCVVS